MFTRARHRKRFFNNRVPLCTRVQLAAVVEKLTWQEGQFGQMTLP